MRVRVNESGSGSESESESETESESERERESKSKSKRDSERQSESGESESESERESERESESEMERERESESKHHSRYSRARWVQVANSGSGSQRWVATFGISRQLKTSWLQAARGALDLIYSRISYGPRSLASVVFFFANRQGSVHPLQADMPVPELEKAQSGMLKVWL